MRGTTGRRVTGALFIAGCVVLGVVTLLISTRNGPAISPPAQRWLFPAGLAMLPLGIHALLFGAVSERPSPTPLKPQAVGVICLCIGLASIGGGLSYDHGERWLVLLLPGAIGCIPIGFWILNNPRSSDNRFGAFLGALMLAVAGIWIAIKAVL